MLKQFLLYQMLRLSTNSEESCREAAQYFDCWLDGEERTGLYEMVHFYGKLTQREDGWFLENGFEEVPVEITSETVGIRMIQDLTEPVHIFADIPLPDPDEEYANFDEDEHRRISGALLITTNKIYQMVSGVASVWDQFKVLQEFYFLRVDQCRTVYRFVTDKVFATNMLRCLGFMASARVDPWFFSERNYDLVEEWNTISVAGQKVDPYRVFSFLDIVGDAVLLSENSSVILLPPTWLSFLAAFSLTQGCSVWAVPGKTLTQLILKEVPHRFYPPTFMLCWILEPSEQGKMVRDLLRCKNKKKEDEIRTRLINFLCVSPMMKLKDIQRILRQLLKRGLNEEELELLLDGKSASIVKDFLRSEYGLAL